MAGTTKANDFEDMLPMMANKLGGDGLIRELCNGFRLLMDKERGVITFESLKKNSALLGLQNLRDDELMSMLREGDLNGDGHLDQMEFLLNQTDPKCRMPKYRSESIQAHGYKI